MAKGKGKWRVAIGLDCWEVIRNNKGTIEVFPKQFFSRALAEKVKEALNSQKAK